MPALWLICCFRYTPQIWIKVRHPVSVTATVTETNVFLCFHLMQGSDGNRCLWSPYCTPQSPFWREGRKTMWITVCWEHSPSALAQAGLTEMIDSSFPCLPFPVPLGYLGQHRAPIRLVCILLEVAFSSMWVKANCVRTCQEGIWGT